MTITLSRNTARTMRLLYLCPRMPYPPDNGGNVRILNLLKYMSRRLEVDLLCFSPESPPPAHLKALQAHCQKLEFVRVRRRTVGRLAGAALASLLTDTPVSVLLDYDSAVAKTLAAMLQKATYDFLYFDFLHTGEYLLRHCRGRRVIAGLHNVESEIWARFARYTKNPFRRVLLRWQSLVLRRYEKRVLNSAYLCTTVCDRDREEVIRRGGAGRGKVRTVDIGIDFETLRRAEGTGGGDYLLFVGSMDWKPNQDAVEELLTDDFQAFLRQNRLRLRVVGRAIPERIEVMESDVMECVENAPDLGRVYGSALAMVVPMRIAGGTRVKIREAMAYGVPVISTRVGAEGVAYADGKDIVIADDVQGVMRAVERLLEDGAYRRGLVAGALELVHCRYDARIIADEFIEFLHGELARGGGCVSYARGRADDRILDVALDGKGAPNMAAAGRAIGLRGEGLAVTHLPPDWGAYLRGNPRATIFHDPGWGQVLAKAYGCRAHYLTLRRDGELVGVLQLVLKRNLLWGVHLCGLSYFDAAGVLADDKEAEAALVAGAADLMAITGAKWAELRQEHRLPGQLTVRTDKVGFALAVPSNPQAVWKQIGPKVRNQVRKAERAGLTAEHGRAEKLSAFYAIYCRTMRDLGSPPHSRRFFELVLRFFAGRASVFLVRRAGRVLGAAVALADAHGLHVPWAASDWRYLELCPNMLLYHAMLMYASERKLSRFDFGRSTRDSGTYRFKKQWGAEERPLFWHYLVRPGQSVPDVRPESPRYRFLVSCWKKLPVAVCRALGPRLIARLS